MTDQFPTVDQLITDLMAARERIEQLEHALFRPLPTMLLVLIESPFAGDRERNRRYLEAAAADCKARGEAYYASHAFYTQFLDDDEPKDRAWGIEAGLAWGSMADKTVVYMDLGISGGMKLGIERANNAGRIVEYRSLPDWRTT